MAGEKILIVDDEPDFSQLLLFDLKKRGYEIVTALNGEEGLTKVESEKPRLIIFDIKMPKMDGYTFAKQVKRRPEFSGIPMIALSSYDMRDLFEIEGVVDYFVKGTKLDSLFDTVDRYLSPGERKR